MSEPPEYFGTDEISQSLARAESFYEENRRLRADNARLQRELDSSNLLNKQCNEANAQLQSERGDLHAWFEQRHVTGSLSIEEIDAMTPRQMADHVYERLAGEVESARNQAEIYRQETHRWSKSCRKLDQKCERLESQFSDVTSDLQRYRAVLDKAKEALEPLDPLTDLDYLDECLQAKDIQRKDALATINSLETGGGK